MPGIAATPYRFGDLLAVARRAWIRQMADELAARGHPGYRRTDALVLRLLLESPLPVGRFAEVLGVTRQGARKVLRGLEERGLVATVADPADARRTLARLTPAGRRYGAAVVAAIDELNTRLAAGVNPADLAAADRVLRAVAGGGAGPMSADRIPPP